MTVVIGIVTLREANRKILLTHGLRTIHTFNRRAVFCLAAHGRGSLSRVSDCNRFRRLAVFPTSPSLKFVSVRSAPLSITLPGRLFAHLHFVQCGLRWWLVGLHLLFFKIVCLLLPRECIALVSVRCCLAVLAANFFQCPI